LRVGDDADFGSIGQFMAAMDALSAVWGLLGFELVAPLRVGGNASTVAMLVALDIGININS